MPLDTWKHWTGNSILKQCGDLRLNMKLCGLTFNAEMSSLSSLIKMCGGVCQLFVVGFPSLCQLHLRCGFCSARLHWRKVIIRCHTGEKVSYGTTLEKSYYTLPHCWRKVIINRHTGDKLSTSSHTGKKLSETAFSLKTRPISSTWHSPKEP